MGIVITLQIKDGGERGKALKVFVKEEEGSYYLLGNKD